MYKPWQDNPCQTRVQQKTDGKDQGQFEKESYTHGVGAFLVEKQGARAGENGRQKIGWNCMGPGNGGKGFKIRYI